MTDNDKVIIKEDRYLSDKEKDMQFSYDGAEMKTIQAKYFLP